ncbi:MAG: Gfo/Idh/MocA family oxidoreductase [Ruminococcus sp.]|nr:Gfo/Idh/MocA family oxidoreductase [Ruminococcus sp.]
MFQENPVQNKKSKVIVCGARFGQFYMEAVHNCDEFELAAVMSNGSEHSRKCAQLYGAELCTDIEQIPDDTDIAAVAVKTDTQGGSGTELARTFIEKGIPVILEQPVSRRELIELYRLAAKKKVNFIVGDHYLYLPAVQEFLQYADIMMSEQKPLYINVDMATQVSFSCCHVLAKLLGPVIKIEQMKSNKESEMPFYSMECIMNNIPVQIRAQNQVAADVSDNYMHIFFKIAVGFPSGTVVLDNIHSSVMYCERFAVPNMEFVPRDLLHADNGQICQESIKLLYHDPKVSYCTVLAEQWPSAIRKEMMDLKEKIGEKYSNADAARCGASVIVAAGLWSSIMECLGYPSVCENPQREYVPFSKLQRMRFGRLRHEERICRITKEHIDKCTEMLEEACLLSMLKTFYDVGLFSEQGDQHSLGEINKRLPHKEKFSYIIMRWLKLLVNKGFLKEREGLYSLQKDINRIAQLPKLWKNIEDLWCNQLGPECIYRYFYENAQVLDRLFTGEKTAAEMLFVGGRSDIADELYQNTLIAYSMNKFIAEQVAAYIAENENKVCILEIGAGTGATSKFVWKKIKLQKLSDKIRKYIFSDLSSYFLEDIKSTAQDYNFVETAIIDAEKLSEYEGLKDNSIDIIIAAGVINNVSDTDSVMKDLKRLLKNGGIILMSEATGESVPMLISQVFMMDAAEDARNASDSTFLSLEQWEKCFQNAGLNCVEQFPTSEHKLSALGQRVFVIRK